METQEDPWSSESASRAEMASFGFCERLGPKKLKCGEITGDTQHQHLGPAHSTHESVPEHTCVSNIYTH